MRVKLIGQDSMSHGEGDIETEKLSTVSILIRNERFYLFSCLSRDGSVVFMETNQPYRMNEF